MKLLVIEDQENLAKLVKTGLEAEGFVVDCLFNGEDAERRIELRHSDYDAVILDLTLPKRDGLDVCKNIRAKKITIPILMLTARDQNNDIINGLNAGADDYLIKPFTFEVLLARVRALLRRPKDVLPTEIKMQGITLNPIARQAFKKNDEIKLTQKEFQLLEYFMLHPNQVITREQLLNSLWDFSFDTFSNVVDVHITNLRKKISDEQNEIIETIFGVGYRFNN